MISCDPDLFPSAEPWPDGVAMRKANAELLDTFVAGLTEAQQRLIFLVYDCDCSFESIAAELSVSPEAVFAMHRRAIASLRREFEMRSVRRYSDIAA